MGRKEPLTVEQIDDEIAYTNARLAEPHEDHAYWAKARRFWTAKRLEVIKQEGAK